jgi:hypothetical protein
VTQFKPNQLQQELAHSQRAEPHPDADMLMALAEDSLPPREREGILSHLAVCVECRDILSLAAASTPLPVAEMSLAAACTPLSAAEVRPQELPRPARLPRRSWLPWVAAAAGIVVICSVVLLLQPRRLPPQASSSESAKLAPKENEPLPAAAGQTADQAANQAAEQGLQLSPPLAPEAKHEKPATRSSAKSTTTPPPIVTANDADTVQQGVAGAPNEVNADQGVSRQIQSATGAQASSQSAAVPDAGTAERKRAFSGAGAASGMLGSLSGRAVRPNWRINNNGQVERSFGNGAWQVVLKSETSQLRVVVAIDSGVWVGGENLQLYHSIDNGTTWNAIKLPDKNGRLSAIVHIRFQTTQEGAVDSEDGTSWTTTDGGRTWQ